MRPTDHLLAISVPVVWGTGFMLSKVAFVYADFPPILLMAFRFLLAALVLVWFVKPPLGHLRAIFAISIVSATIQYSLTFTGLAGMDASTAILVVQMEFPLMALLASLFLGDHLGWRRSLGVAFTFVGIALIAGQPEHQGDLRPILLVASGSLAWAVGQIMVKRLGGAVGGIALTAWVAVFAAPQLFLASGIFETGQMQAIRETGWLGWGVVAYLGLVMTALGYAIWYHVLGKFPVTRVGPYLLLLPVTTIAGSMLFLGERLSGAEMLGGAIVISGVWFVTRRSSDKGDTDPV